MSGGAKNRLARESSPYLLLHAENPVDWYAWGEEAFEKARRDDKPIFLSVGYSTCYWCHVMERECFSDAEIARQLNEGFVSIKLDREERPDLDEVYMTATQLLTRSGGWPNSLFLTHDLKPFFAGTYFPPDDRYGRPGFPRVLSAIRESWRSRRESILEQSEAVAEAMRDQMAATPSSMGLPDAGVGEATQSILARRFDPEWGGFGPAPKFPSSSNLSFLLERSSDPEARRMLVATLDRMARGGIHDQIGGGFHRYSTDREWLVPHFEKMLYDNAALAPLYAEADRLAPEAGFARVARSTLDFVLHELSGPDGGLLSAIDAETHGHEGAYYTWTKDDLREALDEESYRLLALVYGLGASPTFESDRYVLHLPLPLHERARELGISLEELLQRLEPGRRALLDARWKRERPLVDDKVLADWNGLMIGGLARTGAILGEPRYVEAARRAADFVLRRLVDQGSGELLHSWRGGTAKITAFLDDYAFLAEGLLGLHAATGEGRWLIEAARLQAEQDRRLWDEATGGYFVAAGDASLLFPSKSAYDGAVASGNGVAALNLVELARRTGEKAHGERAERLLAYFGRATEEHPLAHVTLVRAHGLRVAAGAGAVALRPASALEDAARGVVEARGVLTGPAAGGFRPFALDVAIREGWHVNANPASLPFLVPLEVSAPRTLRGVRYPAGEPLRSALSQDTISAYQGSVRVEGEVEAGAGGAPVLRLTYQACDEARCLPPVTTEVTLR